jgi:DnaD/phage-associated family protein
MESLGLINRYEVGGDLYIACPNFEKHQSGLRKDRESASKLPAPTTSQICNSDVTTPSLLRSNSRLTPTQVEVEVEVEDNTTPPIVPQENEKLKKVISSFEKCTGAVSNEFQKEIISEIANEFDTSSIDDACKEASRSASRPSIKYVRRILERWTTEGRGTGPPGKSLTGSKKDAKGGLSGKSNADLYNIPVIESGEDG